MSGSKQKAVKKDTTPYKEYAEYLKNYDTYWVDDTMNNLTRWASRDSDKNLENMGQYTFGVDASDEARQRAENATYQSYVDKLTPQFERQQQNYATLLQNQGIPVGSEAYNRAMGELENQQNDALSQAAYKAVLTGQDAYSQSLQNEIAAGNFGNTAQQAYINQLLSALNGSPSGYENQSNAFAAASAKNATEYQNAVAQQKADAANRSGVGGAIGTALGTVIGAYFGGGAGASAGATVGNKIGSSI